MIPNNIQDREHRLAVVPLAPVVQALPKQPPQLQLQDNLQLRLPDILVNPQGPQEDFNAAVGGHFGRMTGTIININQRVNEQIQNFHNNIEELREQQRHIQRQLVTAENRDLRQQLNDVNVNIERLLKGQNELQQDIRRINVRAQDQAPAVANAAQRIQNIQQAVQAPLPVIVAPVVPVAPVAPVAPPVPAVVRVPPPATPAPIPAQVAAIPAPAAQVLTPLENRIQKLEEDEAAKIAANKEKIRNEEIAEIRSQLLKIRNSWGSELGMRSFLYGASGVSNIGTGAYASFTVGTFIKNFGAEIIQRVGKKYVTVAVLNPFPGLSVAVLGINTVATLIFKHLRNNAKVEFTKDDEIYALFNELIKNPEVKPSDMKLKAIDDINVNYKK